MDRECGAWVRHGIQSRWNERPLNFDLEFGPRFRQNQSHWSAGQKLQAPFEINTYPPKYYAHRKPEDHDYTLQDLPQPAAC